MKLKFSSELCRPALSNHRTKRFLWDWSQGKELRNALKSIPSTKAPGNDGLSKEFYEAFYNESKDYLLKSFYHAKTTKSFLHHKGKAL